MMATTTAEEDCRNDALAAAARHVRQSGALGNSAPLLRIFDFLTEASLAGRAAKESEIAVAVFDRSNPQAVVEDATVRVYMHRLRKKLQDFYAVPERAAEGQVAIPRGEYRLVYVPPPQSDVADVEEAPRAALDPPPPEPRPAPRLRRANRLLLMAVASAALFTLGIFTGRTSSAGDTELTQVRAAPLWSGTIASSRPVSVVVGDFYMYGDSPDRSTVTRLIREPTINSSEELDRRLMANPDLIGHHVDLDLHAMPTAVAPALQRILPIVSKPREGWPMPRTLAMSETSADRIKLSNVVYVGMIGGVGSLEESLQRGAKAFPKLAARARAIANSGGERDQDDFAYLASFPGPNGNRVVIIAGLREAGLLQAAEIATSPATIADVVKKARSDQAFEAVFRVTSVGTTNFGAQLIDAGRIDGSKLWIREPAPPEPKR